MTTEEAKKLYQAKYDEYQEHMHKRAWRIAWGFFFITVGLLPMMYVWIFYIQLNGQGWEHTLLHIPKLMLAAALLNFGIAALVIFRLYRKNVELDEEKQRYLAELRALKAQIPDEAPAEKSAPKPERDWDTFKDD